MWARRLCYSVLCSQGLASLGTGRVPATSPGWPPGVWWVSFGRYYRVCCCVAIGLVAVSNSQLVGWYVACVRVPLLHWVLSVFQLGWVTLMWQQRKRVRLQLWSATRELSLRDLLLAMVRKSCRAPAARYVNGYFGASWCGTLHWYPGVSLRSGWGR